MVNKEIITHLKSSIIGLGLTYKDKADPICINGTGFFIDEDGYFITADHVVIDMQKIRDENKKKGIDLDFRGFWYENTDEKYGRLLAMKIEHGRSVHITIPELQDTIPEHQDLMIGRISGIHKFPFLNFDKATKINVFDEIFMCGYPGGDESLRPHDKLYGYRMSPILQHGRVASLLPVDYSQTPFGIQTDIVATGGSSGSPIVDAETGQVLAIAQQVIPSLVTDLKEPDPNVIGRVVLGLTWGISNYFFSDGVNSMLKVLKKEFDEKGRPLPKDQIPHSVEYDDTFYPKKI